MPRTDDDGKFIVQTTLQPGKDIHVDQAELTDLDRMGVLIKEDSEDETAERAADKSTGAPKTPSAPPAGPPAGTPPAP